MSYRGRSAVIHFLFHSLAASSNPTSNKATSLHSVGTPSLSHTRTCQKTCDLDSNAFPAHGTNTDWSETTFPESQSSGAALVRPLTDAAARTSHADCTSPCRSDLNFHDNLG